MELVSRNAGPIVPDTFGPLGLGKIATSTAIDAPLGGTLPEIAQDPPDPEIPDPGIFRNPRTQCMRHPNCGRTPEWVAGGQAGPDVNFSLRVVPEPGLARPRPASPGLARPRPASPGLARPRQAWPGPCQASPGLTPGHRLFRSGHVHQFLKKLVHGIRFLKFASPIGFYCISKHF